MCVRSTARSRAWTYKEYTLQCVCSPNRGIWSPVSRFFRLKQQSGARQVTVAGNLPLTWRGKHCQRRRSGTHLVRSAVSSKVTCVSGWVVHGQRPSSTTSAACFFRTWRHLFRLCTVAYAPVSAVLPALDAYRSTLYRLAAEQRHPGRHARAWWCVPHSTRPAQRRGNADGLVGCSVELQREVVNRTAPAVMGSRCERVGMAGQAP